MKKILSFIAFSLLAVAIASPAMAGTATGSVPVTAQLMASCTISTSTVDFGQMTLANDGTLSANGMNSQYIYCTNTTPFSVAAITSASGGYLVTGNGSDATKKIAYTLGTYSAFNFGLTGTGVGPFTGVGQGYGVSSNLSVNLSVSGLAAQSSIPGSYTDTVLVSVSY